MRRLAGAHEAAVAQARGQDLEHLERSTAHGAVLGSLVEHGPRQRNVLHEDLAEEVHAQRDVAALALQGLGPIAGEPRREIALERDLPTLLNKILMSVFKFVRADRGVIFLRDPQGKLVRVVAGEVFDVAVDIRRGSPTFGRWAGFRLSEANRHMLYVPPGFAQGFLVLSETADFFYQMTAEYAPELDRGVRWDDPQIGIEWPLKGAPLLSDKDGRLPLLGDTDNEFRFNI